MVKAKEIKGKLESFLPWHKNGGRGRPLKIKGPMVKAQVQRSLCLTSWTKNSDDIFKIHSLHALSRMNMEMNDDILVFIFWYRVSGFEIQIVVMKIEKTRRDSRLDEKIGMFLADLSDLARSCARIRD